MTTHPSNATMSSKHLKTNLAEWGEMPHDVLHRIGHAAMTVGVSPQFARACASWRKASCSRVVRLKNSHKKRLLRADVVVFTHDEHCNVDERGDMIKDIASGAILVKAERTDALSVSPNGRLMGCFNSATRTFTWTSLNPLGTDILKSITFPAELRDKIIEDQAAA